jgi:hypothetical protein
MSLLKRLLRGYRIEAESKILTLEEQVQSLTTALRRARWSVKETHRQKVRCHENHEATKRSLACLEGSYKFCEKWIKEHHGVRAAQAFRNATTNKHPLKQR